MNEAESQHFTSGAKNSATLDKGNDVIAVVPAFRAARTIRDVVRRALDVVDHVIVVDDACPEHSGKHLMEVCDTSRVSVLTHERNRGVGGAMKTGFAEALRLGAKVVVKIDADDQMDVTFVPEMLSILKRNRDVELVKGNRFTDPATLRTMPTVRLIGNSALTLLVKISSGYWTIVDPTNGFIAIRAGTLRRTNFSALAEQYFFEIDLLCALGRSRTTIAELEMPAIYRGEPSSLSIRSVLRSFPMRLLSRFLRRIVMNYVIVEINLGTLCGVVGLSALLAGTIFGAYQWHESIASGVGRPTGTIILALLLFTTGFQLTLQAIFYDVGMATKTLKYRSNRLLYGRR